MILTKTSKLTGKEHSMELPITEQELSDYYNSEELIQNFFPQLNADQREFIISGITAEEWEEAFGEDE